MNGHPNAPRNPSPLEVVNSAVFAPAVLNAIQTSRFGSYTVAHSAPWSFIDLPLVTELPVAPGDRDEVNLLIDETNNVVVRMLFRERTGTWTQIGQPPYVSTLPSGAEGMEVYYVADDTNGVVWHLRYDAAEATYNWRFVGGPPLIDVDPDDGTRATNTYGDLTGSSAGPTVTLPLAGDYIVSTGNISVNDTANQNCYMSFAIGGSAAVDDHTIYQNNAGTNVRLDISLFGDHYLTGVAAGSALVCKYKADGGTATFRRRTIKAIPLRVA